LTIRFSSLILGLSFVISPSSAQDSIFRNTNPTVHYVGTKVCSACHQSISASYSKTAMGRSIVHGADSGLRLPVPFTLFDRDAGEYFSVSQNEGEYAQSQYAVDRDGKELFRQTWKLPFVIGSGENGFGFLLQREGYLFEAPLTYYTKTRAWSFSPGYERRNLAFTRPVIAECLGCHAGRPQPLYEKAGLYRDPPFAELAVGCENCHGPGELHVAERRAGRSAGKVDTSIVNPAHLSGWLSDNICMRCHQAGDVRVETPGKHSDDFRPGTPLNRVMAIFKAPLKRDSPAQSVLLEHYFSMTLSRCFRASAGKLSCVSCHNPHSQPTAQEAPVYYRGRCLSCHQLTSCKLPVDDRNRTNPPDDCASCHMPKRTVTTITHAALTDHRVTTHPDEPYREEAFRVGTDAAPGLLLLTATPGAAKAAPIPDMMLFQAYSSLLRDGHPEFRSAAGEALDRLARESPRDPRVLSALARRSLTAGGTKDAIRYLAEAIKAGSTVAEDSLLLADLYIRHEQYNEAAAVLNRAEAENPYVREFPETLASMYVKGGEYRTALEVIRKALGLFPDDINLRMLQKQVQSATIDGAISP
jgi:hypothetical protein